VLLHGRRSGRPDDPAYLASILLRSGPLDAAYAARIVEVVFAGQATARSSVVTPI